ncbi:template-activating factor I [Cryptococcus deuterogattii MMRL2647]|nr:template-activating factor I [Cryptococcus deuterogattii MMRL2647]
MSAEDFELAPGQEGNKNVQYQRFHTKQTQDYLAHLRPNVKDVDQFWRLTRMLQLSHQLIAPHVTSKLDQHALSFLEDIELKQDVNDFRPYELVFTLSKKYTLKKDLKPAPADGSVTDELRKFNEEQDLQVNPITIDWKDGQNLCERMPRQAQAQPEGGEADDLENGFEGDPGSFFWYFQEKADFFNFGEQFKDDILPEAFAYFEGRGESGFGADSDDDDDDDSLDEEDDEDEDEIDLEEDEKPKKKRKVGAH